MRSLLWNADTLVVIWKPDELRSRNRKALGIICYMPLNAWKSHTRKNMQLAEAVNLGNRDTQNHDDRRENQGCIY